MNSFSKMKVLPALLCVLPLISAPLQAEIDRTQKPKPGPAPEASFPDYKEKVLSNGLKVFVVEDDRKPTVTFRLIIKAGGTHEGEMTGLSGFVATLLNRGTEKRNAAQFAQEADYLGVQVEGSAGDDSLAISAGGLTKYTDQILDLLSDAVLHPVFPQDQLERVRKQTLSKLAAERQEPEALADKLTGKILFGSHPYGAYRTPETVKAITRDALVSFHKTWFSPTNATLAIVGDVKADAIVPRVEAAFQSWEKRTVPDLKLPVAPKLEGRTVHLVDRPGSVQSNIVVCEPGPARNNPDLPGLNVLNATLGGGFSGRLFANLREKHGWTYGAFSGFSMSKLAGSFEASAETRNEVTAPAVEQILAEIDRIRTEPIPDPELELQRQYNVGNYLLSLENAVRTATRVQDIDFYGLPADFYKRYAKRMASVTVRDAQELAKRYLSTQDVAIVVVGEAKDIKAGLEKFGKVTVYDTDLKPVGQ